MARLPCRENSASLMVSLRQRRVECNRNCGDLYSTETEALCNRVDKADNENEDKFWSTASYLYRKYAITKNELLISADI